MPYRDPQLQVTENDLRFVKINPDAEMFLYKPWRLKGYFQFKVIINVLVSRFRFIYIPTGYVMGINILILALDVKI